MKTNLKALFVACIAPTAGLSCGGSPTGTNAQAAQACRDMIGAFVDVTMRCNPGALGATSGAALASQAERSMPGGSCDSFTGLRDSASFYGTCLPYIRALPCSALTNGSTSLNSSSIDPSCRGQLQIGSWGGSGTTQPPPTSGGGSGGTSGGSSSGGSTTTTPPPPATPVTCAEGNSAYCSGDGMRWTGTTCCVDNAPICTDGNSAYCSGPSMAWTGRKCCLRGNVECTDGNSAYCSGSGLHWTGSKCCVDGPTVCTDGNSAYCSGSGKRWTGTKCCLVGG
ncbi:MAG: hypothetical protein HYY84_04055 [Deltaproteobacteria bacterium]|nr:hypothetical protein [Deltaproteobacteria bacterium]